MSCCTYLLIHRISIRLSDAGLGSRVGFVSNLTSLSAYATQWSMSYIWRPNRLGGCYTIQNLGNLTYSQVALVDTSTLTRLTKP